MRTTPPFPSAHDSLESFAATRLRIARMRVLGGESLKGVIREITAEVAEALCVERVGVWFFVEDRQFLSIYHLHTRSSREAYEGALIAVKNFPVYFESLETGHVMAADDVSRDARLAELREPYCEPLGITSMLDAPVIVGGQIVGVVCHEHVGPARSWTREENQFAASVADKVAVKVAEAARGDVEAVLQGLQGPLTEMRQMSMLGRMAAGLAHDLNNLLTVMLGNAELITTASDVSSEVRSLATEIQATAHRGRDLAHELLEFGRARPSSPRLVPIGEHLERFVATVSRGLGRGWSVVASRAQQVGRVMIDPRALERAILNLTINARDAMPDGGVIHIDTSDATVGDGPGVPGNYVLVRVTDQGRGMDEATRARIFEPFFTTKGESAGSAGHGLGLSIVYDIVNRAGGFIHVDSEPGRGTSVRVYLPRMA